MSKPAIKSDWKTLEPPTAREPLGYEQTFDIADADKLRGGLIPQQMEDKWFVYYQEGWLYLHRSWTGGLVYWLRLDESAAGARVVESFVSRDSSQYKAADISYDRMLIDFLLRGLILGKKVPFPIRQHDVESGPKGVYQHHIVGRAYPEKIVPNHGEEVG